MNWNKTALLIFLLLTGCSMSPASEQQVIEVMDKIDRAEITTHEVQMELMELETREQQLFNTTMKMTQQGQEELLMKVMDLKSLLSQRLAKLDQEEALMVKTKVLVDELDRIIEKMDGDERKGIEQLKEVILNRYKQHTEFVTEYKKLAVLQIELYDKLSLEETQFKELTVQVNKINSQKEKVQSAISLYNKWTEKVNTLLDIVL